MRKPRNKNLGKHPLDPEFDDNYDYEEDLRNYEAELEAEEERKRINEYYNEH